MSLLIEASLCSPLTLKSYAEENWPEIAHPLPPPKLKVPLHQAALLRPYPRVEVGVGVGGQPLYGGFTCSLGGFLSVLKVA